MTLSGFYSHPWAWNEIGFGGPGLPARVSCAWAAPPGPTPRAKPYEMPGATDEDPVQVVQNGEV